MKLTRGLTGRYEVETGDEAEVLEVNSTDPALTAVGINVPASPTVPPFFVKVNGVLRAWFAAAGGAVFNSAALATNATDGFLYLPSGAGAPTGTPVAHTGTIPRYVDSTNSKLYLYIGGAWKSVTLA